MSGETILRPSEAPPWMDGVVYDTQRALAQREPVLKPGTSSQYYRGDKTWAELSADVVAFVPAGGIEADTVQGAIAELDAEMFRAAGVSSFSATLLDNADAASWRGDLGLGALAIRDAVNNDYWVGLDLALENGGTGASNAAAARANLGVQPTNNPTFTGTLNAAALTTSGEVVMGADASVAGLLRCDELDVDGASVISTTATATKGIRIRANGTWYRFLAVEA